ncbi:MAG: DNA translocase FtsK 4TM domain-containing protein, partial [Acidimicrobiales bacterium]
MATRSLPKPKSRPPAKPARRRPPTRPARRRLTVMARGMWSILRRQSDDLWGVVLIGVGVLVALGIYADVAGPAGSAVDRWTGALFGGGRLLLPPALWWVGASLVRGRGPADPGRLMVGFSLLALSAAGLLHLMSGGPGLSAATADLAREGGWLGAAVSRPLRALLAPAGAGVVLVTAVVLASLIVTRTPVHAFVDLLGGAARSVAGAVKGTFRWLTARDPDDERDAAVARHPTAGPTAA